jgi:hypothetical protein
VIIVGHKNIEIISKTAYLAIKKALFEAIRHFCENKENIVIILVKSNELKSRYIQFSRNKMEKELGFKLFGNLEGFVLATLRGENGKPDGILHSKKNIIKIFNNSTI